MSTCDQNSPPSPSPTPIPTLATPQTCTPSDASSCPSGYDCLYDGFRRDYFCSPLIPTTKPGISPVPTRPGGAGGGTVPSSPPRNQTVAPTTPPTSPTPGPTCEQRGFTFLTEYDQCGGPRHDDCDGIADGTYDPTHKVHVKQYLAGGPPLQRDNNYWMTTDLGVVPGACGVPAVSVTPTPQCIDSPVTGPCTSPTPGAGSTGSCTLSASCNGLACTFNSTYAQGGANLASYQINLHPDISNFTVQTGWEQNQTVQHVYLQGTYTAELEARNTNGTGYNTCRTTVKPIPGTTSSGSSGSSSGNGTVTTYVVERSGVNGAIVNNAAAITSKLVTGNDGLKDVYTGQQPPLEPYLDTYLVIDSYNQAGVPELNKKDHSSTESMILFWNQQSQQNSGYLYIDYTNGSHKDILQSIQDGNVIFFEQEHLQATSSSAHAAIVRSISIDEKTGDGTIKTYEADNTFTSITYPVDNWNIKNAPFPYITFGQWH